MVEVHLHLVHKSPGHGSYVNTVTTSPFTSSVVFEYVAIRISECFCNQHLL
jgi:hypothetical protein